MEYMERMKMEDPTFLKRMQQNEELIQRLVAQQQNVSAANTVITVPVVFHIMYQNAAQNISQDRILDQVAVLNKDYARLNADTNNTPLAFRSVSANTNIRFCLAQRDPNGNPTNGIVRKLVTIPNYRGFDPVRNDSIKFTSLGGDDAWSRSKYLNVWVSKFGGSSSNILGISQLPGGVPADSATDGCCVLYTAVGGNTFPGTEIGPGYNYSLGRTLTHEVGHWFGLYHVWGNDAGGCSSQDLVNDTPNQWRENYGCPTFPHTDACTFASPGVMFMNYLDYVDDNCMNMFTAGQSVRMNSFLNGFRSGVLNSNGCVAVIGIDEMNSFVTGFSVFPNPAQGIVTVIGRLNKKADVIVTITDVIGKIIFSKNLNLTSDIHLPIDLSENAEGIYNLSLRTTNGIINKKIILIQ